MSEEPTLKPKGGVFGAVLYVIWIVGVFIAVPYYNWQFANQHGFATWLVFGEIVPTLKGVFWPLYVAIDYLK